MNHLLLSAALLAACDFIEVGECLAPGELWGPCIDSECGAGLYCFAASTGMICVPPYISEVPDNEHLTCGEWRAESIGCRADLGFCFLDCSSDVGGAASCKGGTACDSWTQMCVYPF